MRSFGTVRIDDVDYLYRKRTAKVNVFGRWQTAGKDFFGCWRIDETGGRIDLDSVDDETKAMVFHFLYGSKS